MGATSAASGASQQRTIPARLRTYGRGESKPSFAELIGECASSAFHLEIHDWHITDDPRFLAWKEGRRQPEVPAGRAFQEAVQDAVARGVQVHRVRLVSEPVNEYVRWEHSITTEHNLAIGEAVRWLPRAFASTLTLPGNPFWVFDGRLVRFSIFDGNGSVVGHQFSESPEVASLCSAAFEAAWDLATDHEDYTLD
ncbi:DUF6879 family protein [Actinomadura roseirufa]|uniref:DUF6879 family protein n=1 Tax=Actinomadura roseirufa TaxID=2094049 RepID=UPI001F5FDD53|nr:DUF6879 family protein [Actinomadura roseirufa]